MSENQKTKKSPRRRAREFAVQALYQSALNNSPRQEIANHLSSHSDFKNADKDLFQQLFFGAVGNQEQYLQALAPHLERDEKLINPIERAILLMASHELHAMPETPHAVVINEAIEITKTFGGTDSHKFVNGVLDKLANQIRNNLNRAHENQSE